MTIPGHLLRFSPCGQALTRVPGRIRYGMTIPGHLLRFSPCGQALTRVPGRIRYGMTIPGHLLRFSPCGQALTRVPGFLIGLLRRELGGSGSFRALPSRTVPDKAIEQLAAQIRHHRACYYNQQPEVSDAEFDALEDRLRALAPDHPVLAELGAPPQKSELEDQEALIYRPNPGRPTFRRCAGTHAERSQRSDLRRQSSESRPLQRTLGSFSPRSPESSYL